MRQKPECSGLPQLPLNNRHSQLRVLRSAIVNGKSASARCLTRECPIPTKESQFRFQSMPLYDSVAPLGVSIPRVVLQVDSPGPEKGILHPHSTLSPMI